MIVLFNSDGGLAGMQSIIPADDFICDCKDNQYYTKENITNTDVSKDLQ